MVEREVGGSDDAGQPIHVWSEIGARWANVKELSQLDRVLANGIILQTTHDVTMREDRDVGAGMRLRWGSRVLEIRGIIRDDSRDGKMLLSCVERTQA